MTIIITTILLILLIQFFLVIPSKWKLLRVICVDRNRSFLFFKSECAFLKIGVFFFENRCLKIHAFYWASLKKIGVCCRKLEFCHLCLIEIGVCYLKIQAGFFLKIGDSFENRSLFSKIRVCHLCLIEIGVRYLNIMNPSCFFIETWSQFRKSDFLFENCSSGICVWLKSEFD